MASTLQSSISVPSKGYECHQSSSDLASLMHCFTPCARSIISAFRPTLTSRNSELTSFIWGRSADRRPSCKKTARHREFVRNLQIILPFWELCDAGGTSLYRGGVIGIGTAGGQEWCGWGDDDAHDGDDIGLE